MRHVLGKIFRQKRSYWIIRGTSALALVFLLLMTTTCGQSKGQPETVGNIDTDAGHPNKVTVVTVDPNEKVVRFGIITDSHTDTSASIGSSWANVRRNQTLIKDFNIDCVTAGCLGAVHMGDMIDTKDIQKLIAFRQLYEQGYPGKDAGAIANCDPVYFDCHDWYSEGHRINKAVLPTIGNHDLSKYSDGWAHAVDYIGDLIVDAPGIISRYKKATYTWRWGRYWFIQLGLWAGDCEYENAPCIDYNKINWLKAWLSEHVGTSGDGVLIFQHYGWDGGTSKGKDANGNAIWWSDFQRELEVNVLCRRENSSDPCNKYNVLGIFTGHNHDQDFPVIPAGKDTKGKDVSFQNIVFRDSGFEADHYGYSIVYLDGVKLKINTKNVGGNEWYWWEKDINLDP